MTKSHPARRGLSVVRFTLACALGALVLSACEPTPNYLQRWANTPGSEDRFIEYLHDPDLSHEVRVKALELLIEQWDYSMSELTGGKAVRDIPDAESRDEILADVTPRVRELYDQGDGWRTKMRDAAFHLRQGTADPQVQAGFDAILLDWFTNHWDPCLQGGGVVSTSQLLTALGPEDTAATIDEVVAEGAFDRVLCFTRDASNVPWLQESSSTAQAFVTRWDEGEISDNTQLKFEYFEAMLGFSDTEVMRTWLFARLSDDSLEPLFKNAILDAVAQNPTDADIEGYTELLANETYARWAAFQAIVNARGSDGLEHVLSSLPADSEYAFYDGRVRADGLRSVADNIVCKLTKLEELGDNARVVFERHISDENMPARLISISCLATYGDRQSIQRLNAAAAALSEPVPAPGYGTEATVQSVIAETVAAITARVGG